MVFGEPCKAATAEFSVLSEAMLVKPWTARAKVLSSASSACRTLLPACRVQKYWQYWFSNTDTANTGSPVSGEADEKAYSKLSVVVKIHSYNFMTWQSRICKCNGWSNRGRKILKILTFSTSPFWKAATPSTVFKLCNSKVPRMLSHTQSSAWEIIRHPSGFWKGDHWSHERRDSLYLPSEIWFISCRGRSNSWIRETIWHWPEVFVFTLFQQDWKGFHPSARGASTVFLWEELNQFSLQC